MIPDFEAYLRRIPAPTMDGGYYTKTPENRPLLGLLPVEGAWIIGGLSGFGVMASAGSGDVLAASIVGASVPEFAARFKPSRYNDQNYLMLMDDWESPLEL
jgi:glycine/D-amino acid oxidase-like deaminating enzyme